MGFTLRQKISLLPKEISVAEEIINENIRGIYGIFSLTESTRKCIYIGRAADIASRMQRLAFAESKAITEFQDKGECLFQLSEGSWISEDTWNELYRKRY